MRTADLDQVPYLRLLVYGDSGSGKTTLIGTAQQCEQTFPLLMLNARGQPVSLRYLDPRPLVLDVESMKDFNGVYDWVRKGQPRKDAADFVVEYLDSVGAERFNSIGIDSITHVQRLALNEVIGFHGGPGDIPPITNPKQWGRVLAQMTNLADKYYTLPIHVLMSALTRRTDIEAMGMVLFAPFLWGQSQLEVPSHAEIVGRLMCVATVTPRVRKDIEKAAEAAKAKTPFNLLYLVGGRSFIAKWQGVRNPPHVIPSPTISKMIKELVG